MENTLSETELKSTPLLEEHKKLNAKLAPFGGWLMPIQYEGIIAEHTFCRTSACLFDICHMGEFMIYGDPVQNGFEHIVTQNVHQMKLGTCRYGFMLNDKGGIIDDVIAYRIKPDQWMLVVNAATIDRDDAHLRKNLAPGTKIFNISETTAKLDIQGPLSRDVMKSLVGNRIERLAYYTFENFSLLGEDVIISRTGYTGELGYEIYISAGKVVELWNILLKDARVKPAGLGARDTLRLEVGYPLYGQDADQNTTPDEAGLGMFVDTSKDFIGKSAILAKRAQGLTKKLTYFITSSRRAPRHNYKIFDGTKEIGVVTSGSFSPSLSCGIGSGYIESSFAKIGNKIIVREGNVEIEATITGKPFYKKGTARI